MTNIVDQKTSLIRPARSRLRIIGKDLAPAIKKAGAQTAPAFVLLIFFARFATMLQPWSSCGPDLANRFKHATHSDIKFLRCLVLTADDLSLDLCNAVSTDIGARLVNHLCFTGNFQ